MKKNILLVEPGYKTKFPPLGLMKISAYHKELGDRVRFVKGIADWTTYEKWDRIYISTVFTYHWKITVDTIKFYKTVVRGDVFKIFVGGILATLMAEDLANETGIVPIPGVLSEPRILDQDSGFVVDQMIPDYELFQKPKDCEELEPDYDFPQYSLIENSYFGYSTRGCIRNCEFCGVPQLEPKFIPYFDIKPYVNKIAKRYGEKVHLVLFDNNVLASKKFAQIIKDIKDLGFEKDAKFSYENKGRIIQRLRYVDFNQGTDARLLVRFKNRAKLLSEINLRPLRIAFDHIKDREVYEKSIRLAAKNGIVHLSNYVLYNYNDTPAQLWQRLKINIDLNRELSLSIYSFPMRYIPLMHKERGYINEPNWNWQYLRGVQRILNVVKGSVMTADDFFYRAFGENEKEFIKILHMPEWLLMHRTRDKGVDEIAWENKYNALSENERSELLQILCNNRSSPKLNEAYAGIHDGKVKELLNFYIDVPSNQLFEAVN